MNTWKNNWQYADVGGAIETVGILEGEITKLTKSYKGAKKDYWSNVDKAKLEALQQRKKKLELLEAQKAKIAAISATQASKSSKTKKFIIIGGTVAALVAIGLTIYFIKRK